MTPASNGEIVCLENMRSDWTRILDSRFCDCDHRGKGHLIGAQEVVLHDTVTGQSIHYSSASECGKALGKSRRSVTGAINTGALVAKRYYIEYKR